MNQIRDEFQENMEGQELLHTPGGVRDVYGRECARKMHVKKEVHHILKTHGFQDIETPAFEYFDIFSKERGTVQSREMFKFFDVGDRYIGFKTGCHTFYCTLCCKILA